MSILLGVYSPKEETGVEEVFQSHLQSCLAENTKVEQAAAIPGLKKHIIGRITEVAKGTPVFTNYCHMTWDEKTSMDKYLETTSEGRPLPGVDFLSKISWGALCFVEEKLIFENKATATKKAKAIRFNVCSPKEGLDPEDIFKFHVDVHAPHIMDTVAKVATPGLKRYVIGWVTDVASGKPLFKNYVKMWWDDEAALNRYLEELKTIKLPDGTPQSGPQGELGRQVTWHMNAFVDEDVISESE